MQQVTQMSFLNPAMGGVGGDQTLVNQQYEMIIAKLNQELQKSLVLSQEYRVNYQNVQEQSDELNKKNTELRREIEDIRTGAQKRVEFSESERRKILADLEVKEEETRILKKGIEQLKLEINGQKIELDSKRAINQRVGQNEQNLFKQVTEMKQQMA